MRSSTVGSRRGFVPEAPQLLSLEEDATSSMLSSSLRSSVPLVNYTGKQSNVAGFCSRGKVHNARAAKSDIGSVLFGGD